MTLSERYTTRALIDGLAQSFIICSGTATSDESNLRPNAGAQPHLQVERKFLTAELNDLIGRLLVLKTPDRRIDREIAILAGYRKRIVEKDQPAVWLDPKGGPVAQIPLYTASLDHARDFVRFVAPSQDYGCSWEPGGGAARIDSGPYVQAASPEVALCIAALQAWIRRET